jgi:hypothetical protein
LVVKLDEMRSYARENELIICEDALKVAFATCVVGLASESMKTNDMERSVSSQPGQV